MFLLVFAFALIQRALRGERTEFAPPCAVVEDAFDDALSIHADAAMQEPGADPIDEFRPESVEDD